MKFRLIYLSLILIILISILSGCANATYKINLKNDGTIDVKLTILYSENSQYKLDSTKIEALKQKFIDNNYTIEEVSDKGLNGFEISKKDIYFDESNFILDDTYNVDFLDDILNGLSFSQGFLNNYYTVNSTIDLTSLLNKFVTEASTYSNISITDEEYKKYLSQLNLKLIITVEDGNVIKTNSTLVSQDKKTAEWVLIPGDVTQISLDSTAGYNKATISTYIILGIVFLLAVILIIILLRRYTKRNK